jgi:hypothetical protein
MTNSLTTQEVSIVVAAQQSPALLREDMLKLSGVIPTDWQLSRPPVNSDQMSQLLFTNGCSLAAQPDRLMLLEVLGDRDPEQLQISTIARKYIQTLKAADYQAVGINFRSYIAYPAAPEAADDYIRQRLLQPGPWQNWQGKTVQAGLNLLYELDRCQLTISVNSATIQQAEIPVPILLFSGNFNYEVNRQPPDRRLPTMGAIIDNWITDFDAFHELLLKEFLAA